MQSKPKAFAFIFARGGSKGVPGKNIRTLAGRPLIAYAIEAAKASRYVERVIVSTDDESIADTARKHGAEVPFMRPQTLATDQSAEWLAWQHAVEQAKKHYGAESFDVFVSVPATCPLRIPGDVDRAIEALLKHDDADIIITTTPSRTNPYFTMVSIDDKGLAKLAIKPEKMITRRQDAPRLNDIVGLAYATRPAYIERAKNVWDGKVRAVEIPPERAVDIDTEFDFLLCELLLERAKRI